MYAQLLETQKLRSSGSDCQSLLHSLRALRRQSDVALQRYWLLLRHVRFDELKLLVDIDMTVHLLICRDLQRSNPCSVLGPFEHECIIHKVGGMSNMMSCRPFLYVDNHFTVTVAV